MKRITKQSLIKNLRVTAKGEIHKGDLNKLENLRESIKPNEKLHYKSWTGSRRHMRVNESIDTYLLSKFCDFSCGNDAPRGGVDGDYIIINTKQYNLFLKRLSYFIESK